MITHSMTVLLFFASAAALVIADPIQADCAAPTQPDSTDDGFPIGAKLIGTYALSYLEENGKRVAASSDLEVEVTKRSGKEFTAELWWNKRKSGAQYEGTIDKGQVKARMTKALTDNVGKQAVANAVLTGRFEKGVLTGAVTMPKANPTFKAEVKVKLCKD